MTGLALSSAARPPLRIARGLSLAIAPLAMVAAAAGLLVPAVYRGETAWTVPQVRGQDLVTLLAAPLLAATARRGGRRATAIWLGLLGYMFYTYTAAAFAYVFNELFLVYVALFSLSVFALGSAAAGLDAAAFAAGLDGDAPRRGVARFLVGFGGLLAVLWLGQIVPFLVAGTVPEGIRRAGNGMVFVFVLDLGLVVPLAGLAAAWLRRGEPWGALVAGAILIKGATMGLALLSMTGFAAWAGQPFEPGLAVAWVAIAGGCLAMAAAFFRHLRG